VAARNNFTGVLEYDDGVYYGAAKFLLHGLMPYRDFTIVHPPAICVLLLPFAAIGNWLGDPVGMGTARLAMLVVFSCNTVLVHRLVHQGTGGRRLGAAVAAGVYAVSPTAVGAEHTVLLEPLVTLFCLMAVLVSRQGDGQRHGLLGGFLLAAGSEVKVFGAVYLAALVLSRVRRGATSSAGLLIASYAGGLVLLAAPFLVPAPGRFWHDVVVTQLSRPADSSVAGLARLVDMFGLGSPSMTSGAVVLTLAVLTVTVGIIRGRAPEVGLWVLLVGLTVTSFMVSPSYFTHYGAFLAPAFAIALGMSVGELSGTGPRAGWTTRLTLACVAIILLAGSVKADLKTQPQGNLRQLGRQVAAGSCTFYERASLAIAADLLRVPDRKCPGWLDGRGEAYVLSTGWPADRPFYDDGFTSNVTWQAELLDQLRRSDHLLLSQRPELIGEWSTATRQFVLANFQRTAVASAHGHVTAELWARHEQQTAQP